MSREWKSPKALHILLLAAGAAPVGLELLLSWEMGPGSASAWSFQMHCSSSLSFRSKDHLSPLLSAVVLCRDSLSDLREDRDTWLM